MTHFERMEFPEQNRISYYVIDDFGNKAQLTPEQAYELLTWLYDRRDELFTSMHSVVKELPSWVTAETLAAWKKARATVRYMELRLSRRDWQYLDTLKAALPGLEEEYEAPEEAGQGVKVLSLRADSLTVTAIKLLNDLHLEYTFRDVQVPTGDTE